MYPNECKKKQTKKKTFSNLLRSFFVAFLVFLFSPSANPHWCPSMAWRITNNNYDNYYNNIIILNNNNNNMHRL